MSIILSLIRRWHECKRNYWWVWCHTINLHISAQHCSFLYKMLLVWRAQFTNQKRSYSHITVTGFPGPSRGFLSEALNKKIGFLTPNIIEIATQNGHYCILCTSESLPCVRHQTRVCECRNGSDDGTISGNWHLRTEDEPVSHCKIVLWMWLK